MEKPKAYLRDRLYVPSDCVTEDMLAAFESQVMIGKDPAGKDNLYATVQHYQHIQTTRDNAFYAFNRGNMAKIEKIFRDFEIKDERVTADMRHDLQMKFPEGMGWRDYQPDGIAALMDHDYGILKSPTRSGKTLMLTGLICAERQRTILFAHQTDLLVQCMDTFEKFTNVQELRDKTGDRIVGFADNWEDFFELDVVFCTKQTFDHLHNRQQLPAIQRAFGLVLVDEAHFSSSELYSRLINRFWARKRQGCTATPVRKDELHVIAEEILGPVIYEIDPALVGRVPIQVEFIWTGVEAKKKSMQYVKMLSYLSEIESRNRLICERIAQDVADGHTVLAVTDRKQHCYALQKMLQEKNIPTATFTGDVQQKKKRKELLDSVRSGQNKVMILMRNMTTGLDIPRASVFHNCLPSSNSVKEGVHAGEGGYEQQCTRVLTNFPGKDKAIIRDYIDGIDLCWSAKRQREKTYRKLEAEIVGSKFAEKKKEKQQLSLMVMGGGSSTEF